jgi:hypothetical protein
LLATATEVQETAMEVSVIAPQLTVGAALGTLHVVIEVVVEVGLGPQ